MEAMASLRQLEDSALVKILNTKQRQRLSQIALQREGNFALTREDMQAKLNMGPDQVEQVAEIMGQMRNIQQEARKSQRDMFASFRRPDGSFDREAMKAQMDSAQGKAQMEQARKQQEQTREQASQALAKVLRKKQKASFEKMQGPPFDLSKLNQGGPFGFGGRNRGPGGPGATKDAPDDSTDKADTPKPGDSKTKKKGSTKRKSSA
jgi:hypothetical protein